MSTLHLFLLATLANVTLVTAAALVLIACSRRWPAFRHAAGVIGLMVVMFSPLVVLALPRPAWLSAAATETSTHQRDVFDPSEARAVVQSRPKRHSITSESVPDFGVDESQRSDDPFAVPSDIVPMPTAPVTLPDGIATPVPAATRLPSDPPEASVANPPPRSFWITMVNVLAGLWCLGMSVVGLREWQKRRVLNSFTRNASDWVSQRAGRVTQDVCSVLEIKTLPAVRVSDWAPLPFLMGVWRPVVILPRQLAELASHDQLRDVLVHEVAHIVRRDPPIHTMQRVMGIVFWFHPGVAWLNRQIGRAREELCDNFVLRCGDAAGYAQTLLDLSESCGRQRQPLPALGLFSTRWTLEQRVSGLLDPRRDRNTRPWRGTSLVLAAGLASVCLIVGGIGLLANQAAPAPSYARPAAPTSKTSIVGTCIDEQGKPVANALVRLLQDQARSSTRGQAEVDPITVISEMKSDEQGRFAFDEVSFARVTPYPQEQRDYYVVASAPGRAPGIEIVGGSWYGFPEDGRDISLTLAAEQLTVSGVVTDSNGKPVTGALVFMSTAKGNPLPGIWSSMTDNDGRYAITDLERWQETVTETFDANGNKTETMKTFNRAQAFNSRLHIRHPDFAPDVVQTGKVPNQIDLTLMPAAVLEGQVIDKVVGKPAKSVTVFAQGIIRDELFQAATDQEGRYRFLLPQDDYNVWVDAEDRIAPVRPSVATVAGKTVDQIDLDLTSGGYVVGTVFDLETQQPVAPTDDKPFYVAHYGPACIKMDPLGGWVVGMPTLNTGVQQDTRVRPDGTFRLRVAPGKNHVFFLKDYGETTQSIQAVNVDAVQEQRVRLYVDISSRGERSMEPTPVPKFDDSQMDAFEDHVALLRYQAKYKLNEAAIKSGKLANNDLSPIPSRVRSDSPVNRLLDQYEIQSIGYNSSSDTKWLTVKAIVDLGRDAVPDLIEELDATRDPWILQLLGFTLRALDDRRAIPALIRAVPRTLLPPEPAHRVFNLNEGVWPRELPGTVQYTLTDPMLFRFVRRHALSDFIDETDGENRFTYGSPVQEICGALTKLAGAHNGEQEITRRDHHFGASLEEIQRDLQEFEQVKQNWILWWNVHQNDPLITNDALLANDPPVDETAAIEQIKKLGGSVSRDGAWPGNPVIRVQFANRKPVAADELAVLRQFKQLQVLFLPGNCEISPEAIHVVCDLASLTELHFGGSKGVNGHLNELPRLTNLAILGLVGCRITNDDLKAVGQMISLKRLDLAANQINDEGLRELASLVSLEQLELTGTELTDACFTSLKDLRSLKSLQLRYSSLTGSGLHQLKDLTNLTFLDLSDTKVSGLGLGELKHLTNLKLNGTRVRDAAAKEIAELPSLKWLDLSDTKITDTGLQAFNKLIHLRQLEIKETDTSDEACADLKRVLPDLRITN